MPSTPADRASAPLPPPSEADPARARREHFGQFYGLRPVDPAGRPVVLVHGNCQAGSVRRLLETSGACAVRVPPVHELETEDLGHLARLAERADALVAQPVRADYRGLPVGTEQVADLLPGGAPVVIFPVLRFAGIFPFQVTVRPSYAGSVDPPVVPYHDLRLLLAARESRRCVRGLPLSRALRLVEELTEAVDAAAVGRLTADSLLRLRRRELAHDAVAASAVLAGMLPAQRTHHTLNHPTNAFLAGVVPLVIRRLAEAGIVLDPAPQAPEREMLGGIRAPVTAAARAAFPGVPASQWTGPGWLVDGVRIPEEEVARAQLAWYARHPGFVDAGLTRHAETLELLGLTHALESTRRRAPHNSPRPASEARG
ncbi:hypothetical protein ILP97_54455 [Amycolatopsis sp. H6(2020)]|nr:hypothetical protein [Amycolatopsis sp. H6(2020)]